jgi:hypothetical protein
MPFTIAQIEDAERALGKWLDREDDLSTALTIFSFQNQTAAEFMNHGLGRRLHFIKHSIQRVFDSVPMDATNPTNEALLDATAYFHTFAIHVSGAVDNMAHIWCNESPVRNDDGSALRRDSVGFRKKHAVVRSSLSEAFRNYLTQADKWFYYLDNYRDALAHRIPPYIPPRTLAPEAQAEHAQIQDKISKVLSENWNRDQYFSLLYKQSQLGVFDPWITHSYGEAARPVRFHAQLINDFATVIEIGEHLLQELKQNAAAKKSSDPKPHSPHSISP